jgi:Cys-tRNA(Pro)/Cys-tRNA(Cys) deacylase
LTRRDAGGTPATVALARAGIAYSVHPYDHDHNHPSYGMEAAEALGVHPSQVFKTLLADVDGQLVVAVVPVNGSLDLKAMAAAVGGKRAAMAEAAVAERVTGYVVGGISPVGQRRRLPTVIDDSALDCEIVYVSGGRRGLDLGLSPVDLLTMTQGVTAAIRSGRADERGTSEKASATIDLGRPAAVDDPAGAGPHSSSGSRARASGSGSVGRRSASARALKRTPRK